MDPQVLKFCATIRTCVGPNRSFCLGNFFRRHRSFFCFLGWYIFFSCIFWLNYLDQITTYSQKSAISASRVATKSYLLLVATCCLSVNLCSWPSAPRAMGRADPYACIRLRHTACSPTCPPAYLATLAGTKKCDTYARYFPRARSWASCAQELRGNFEFYHQGMLAYCLFFLCACLLK